MNPWQRGGIEAGGAGGYIPRTQFGATGPPAGAQEQSIPGTDFDVGKFLPRFQIRRRDHLTRLHVRNVFHQRDIHQDGPCHVAFFLVFHAKDGAAVFAVDPRAVHIVVQLALEGVMAQRVDMGDDRTVIPDGVEIHGVTAGIERHFLAERARAVRRLLFVNVVGQ